MDFSRHRLLLIWNCKAIGFDFIKFHGIVPIGFDLANIYASRQSSAKISLNLRLANNDQQAFGP